MKFHLSEQSRWAINFHWIRSNKGEFKIKRIQITLTRFDYKVIILYKIVVVELKKILTMFIFS